MTGLLLLGTVHWPFINTLVEMSFFVSPTATRARNGVSDAIVAAM